MKVQDKRFSKRFFFQRGNVDIHIFHYSDGNIAIVLHYDVVDNSARITKDFYGTRQEAVAFLKEVF